MAVFGLQMPVPLTWHPVEVPGPREQLSQWIRSPRICRKGFWDQLSCAHFALFSFILIGSDGPNICRTPLSPSWDEVISSTFHQVMEPVQISVKAYIIPWLYCRLV